MSIVVASAGARERSHAPRLRLLRSQGDAHAEPLREEEASRPIEGRPALRLLHQGPAHVLVAGTDSARRAVLLDELTQTMPQSTLFEEASAVWEVLEHAPASRAVILSGDLDDASVESLVRLLSHRYPRLPVVSIDAPAPHGDLRAHA
jgi:hypothetical protein